jgi:hypothetical protein
MWKVNCSMKVTKDENLDFFDFIPTISITGESNFHLLKQEIKKNSET